MELQVLVDAEKVLLIDAEEKLKAAVESEVVDTGEVRYLWAHYKRVHKVYTDLKLKLLDQLQKKNLEEDYVAAKRVLFDYERTLFMYEEKVNSTLAPQAKEEKKEEKRGPNFQQESSMRMILPKRQLPKFTGDVREWLAFKASFGDIDEDESLSKSDKFHFLIQSTVDGSPARKILQGYPITSANYTPAYKALEDTFGKKTTLVKVYVRDLLQLVIGASTGQKKEFCDLVSTIQSQLSNLATLGVTTEKCELVLYPVVESCLPYDILLAWQRDSLHREDLESLLTFLHREVNAQMDRNLAQFTLGSSKPERGTKVPINSNPRKKFGGEVPTASSFVSGSQATVTGGNTGENRRMCVFCAKSHPTSECRSSAHMSLYDKRRLLRDNGCCFLCLEKTFHFAKDCKANPKCKNCGNLHLTVMCPQRGKPRENAGQTTENEQAEKLSQFSNTMGSTEVPMQTLVVTLHGTNGKSKKVRMMIDTGSARSYIRSDIASELKLQATGEESVVHELFGARETGQVTYKRVKLIVSDIKDRQKCMFDCSAISDIANNVHFPQSGAWLDEFCKHGVVFSDIKSVSSKVDVLLGNDVAPNVYTSKRVVLASGPAAMETRWAWVLGGKLPQQVPEKKQSALFVSAMMQIDKHPLSALWELEAIGITDHVVDNCKEELAASTQKHFDETVQQMTDGRYQVALPWITGCREKLPSNYFAADRRLRTTTKDLQAKGYLEKYDELFKLWEAEEMIEEVPPSELNSMGHYLPHRAVVKLSSATTPIRPVFDGSEKGKGNFSLNDCLDKGPNLLELIPPILTRFRLRAVGITADIKKAFQQISVSPTDRDFLRFLWWKDLAAKEVKVYRHARVVFGVTSSPYLLGATLHHHLKKVPEEDIATAQLILKSMYVDNVLLSLDSLSEAGHFQQKSVNLLAPAQFDLRAWEFGPTEEEKIVPVLGLLWKTGKDVLSLDIDDNLRDKLMEEPSLRHVLSLVHSIFDPLGFVSPFVIVGKLLLRRCHDAKVGLDTPVDTSLKTDVLKWAAQIPLLAQIEVPRHVCFGESAQYSLHVLCDSSSLAIAAAVFLRRKDNREVKVFLLSSKSRVAPKKKATIPRLELVACVIATRLLHTVFSDMCFTPSDKCPITLWSDSSTALAWIRGKGPWGVFVTNRVKEIRDKVDVACWRHIPGKENIADLPSRGCSAQKLIDSKWWRGPGWLYLPPEQWPSTELPPEVELVDGERKKIVIVATASSSISHPMLKFLRISSYPKILQSISIWLGLKKKLRHQSDEDFRSAASLKVAETYLLLFIQEDFRREPQRLKQLNPFVDEKGLLRTKTRLTLEDDDESFQCPILLPDNNDFVTRLIE